MSTIVTRIYEPCHKVTAACDGKSNTAVYLDAIAPPITKTASANSEALFILFPPVTPIPRPTTDGYSRAVISRVRTPSSST